MKKSKQKAKITYSREKRKVAVAVTCIFIGLIIMKGYISIKRGIQFVASNLTFVFILFFCLLDEWISRKMKKEDQSVKAARICEKRKTVIIYTFGLMVMVILNVYASITKQAHFMDINLILMFLIVLGSLIDWVIEKIKK